MMLWLVLLSWFGPAVDFQAFLLSADHWRTHGTLYPDIVYPNLNLPHTSALFVMLSYLPFAWALVIWKAVQLACAARVLWLMREELSPLGWLLVAVAQPTVNATQNGQIVWLVAWLVVEAAVRNARKRRSAGAAVWLTIAVLIKPFLGLVLLGYLWRHPRAVRQVAAIVLFVGVVGIALFGASEYIRWWYAAQRVAAHTHPANISISGVLSHTGLSSYVPVLVLVVVLGSGWALYRGGDVWRVLLPASLLVSPLTWLYYAWVLAPVIRRDWNTAVACLLLAVPIGLVPPWLPLGAMGLGLLWVRAIWRPEDTAGSLRTTGCSGYC
jgi:hypothetical protein